MGESGVQSGHDQQTELGHVRRRGEGEPGAKRPGARQETRRPRDKEAKRTG